jgi:hypothetical protein
MRIACLRLSIIEGSDPIEGSTVGGDQEPQPFCGWVELVAAIEAVRAARDPESNPGVVCEKD